MTASTSSGRWSSGLAWALVAVLSVGTGLFSYGFLVGVGPRSPEILSNVFARPWLCLYIAGAATALLVGAFQFMPGRPRRGHLHRLLGRVYVAGCPLGAIGGFVLSFGSYTGPIVTVGFGSLAVIWFTTTLLGWRTAVQRRFVKHRRWMVRSWALTLAALNLRLYLPVFAMLHVAAIDGYRATSFLAWVPNLLIAEVYLRWQERTTNGSATMPRFRRWIGARGAREAVAG